jgi:hypothetical protein
VSLRSTTRPGESLDSAVPSGVNLFDHARALARTHAAVLDGQAPALAPRAVVARSWQRVMDLGLPSDGSTLRDPLPRDEVRRRRAQSPLDAVIGELTQVIAAVADASQILLVVTDADGVVLWREGTSSVRRRADTLGFAEGAEWTEARVGTNAIGTALAEAAPVQLFSAEHYERAQHPWYCTASPIHDPRTGRLLGVIDVSGPALTLHPAIGALVETARRLAESQLWRRHEQQLGRIRRAAAPVLARVGGPALVVDDDGWVADSIGVLVGDRIAVPAADRVVSVPGLGLCLPEPLAHGWLVRPPVPDGCSGCVPPALLELRLDLSGEPAIEVVAGNSRWRRRLTVRHAEIFLLLHRAGPQGLTARALSRALFGDGDHVVTVRAEISRLRRTLGALVDTRPYRLAAGTVMTLDLGPAERLADCRFVRASTSPGVRVTA